MDFSEVEARVAAHMADKAVNGRFLGVHNRMNIQGTVTGRFTNYSVQEKAGYEMLSRLGHLLEIDKRIGVDKKGRPLLNPIQIYDDSVIIPAEKEPWLMRQVFKVFFSNEPNCFESLKHMWT
jgi:hypothetical protein